MSTTSEKNPSGVKKTTVVPVKARKPVLQQLIMQPDKLHSILLFCCKIEAYTEVPHDSPGQLDVRSEGVRFPWAGHVTLMLPGRQVSSFLKATQTTGEEGCFRKPLEKKKKYLRSEPLPLF